MTEKGNYVIVDLGGATMKGLLAFDLGTSGVKCSVFDSNGKLLGARYGEYPTYYPHTDWREQRPSDWIAHIVKGTKELMQELPFVEICGIGVSGHSLGALPVDREGHLLAEQVPIWSDARATEQAERFFEKVDYRSWYEQTGNGFPRELYSIFKIMWYKEHQPELYANTDKFIGTKDYVNLFLTGNAVTDISYASGCGLFDLKNGCYCPAYAEAAGLDLEKFPEVFASCAIIGHVTQSAAEELGISAGIPVAAGGVDNACMTLGAGCFENGDVYASLGSSAWVTASISEPVVDFKSKIYTFAHCVPGQYLPSIGIFASGSALAWAADRWFADITGGDRFDKIGQMASESEAGARGVMFNPSLAGGCSFDKSTNIRGTLFNLDLGNTRNDIARAVFEGIAMHLWMASSALEESGHLGNRLLVVGGGSKGAFARQTYADVFGKEVAVSSVRQDAASLGAAALAAVGSGLWESFAPLRQIHKDLTLSKPNMENHTYYAEIAPIYRQMCDACADLGDMLANR